MLRPAITQIITKNESVYSLVVGVAKRARQITEELYEENQKAQKEFLREKENSVVSNHDFKKDIKEIKKPVQMAVDDFYTGRYKIVECSTDTDNNEDIIISED